MNLKQTISNFLNRKAFDPMQNINLSEVVGWRTMGGSTIYGYYQDHQYENGYSSISKLANGFAVIEPFAVDKTGKSVGSNILDRIYSPNTDMSAYDFREALAVTSLVHDKVLLRVHYDADRVTVDTIKGFTFMEAYTEVIVEGKRQYLMPNGVHLDDSEVITLKSVDPDNITGGFSPSRAAKRWTRLDDYIADYQKGFFENGAVPSGQLVITARTVSEFKQIRETLQARHKGAGRNNNVTYTHRPTDQNGTPLNSQIEWVPFSSQNKDMALKDLFDNVNKKIDSVYGVPEEIRGHLSNSNYASVTVAEKVFVKYALHPLTLKIWQKFTHEINRVTGGAGIAIDFELEIPVIADEDKVKAEAKGVDAKTVGELVTQGFTLQSAVEYVKTGNIEVLTLETKDTTEPIVNDEVKDQPSQPIDIYSKAIEYTDRRIAELQPAAATHSHVEHATKRLDVIDTEIYRLKFENATREQMSRQVERAIASLDDEVAAKAYGDNTEQEDAVFTAALLALMIPLMTIYGNKATTEGIALLVKAELQTQGISQFEFTPAQLKQYERYLAKIGTSYAEQTAEEIRSVLKQGISSGAPRAEIENNLRKQILGSENEYRVKRLARTEVNLAEGKSSVFAMENIQAQTGVTIYKVWRTSSSQPCVFCEEMNGSKVLVHDSFVPLGDDVKAGDAIFSNNWTNIESAQLHANCNCYTTYEIEKG